MRIVFIGQAPFGRDVLKALIKQGEEIAGVITIPDSPNPAHKNPVKEWALENDLPLFQSRLLKPPEVVSWVKDLQPDLLVLAFVTAFVPEKMLDLAPLGGINYHPSLLPKYRGGSAINWAVINGEAETGVSVHFVDPGVDTGPIILQEKVEIAPDDTVKSLYFEKLYPMGVRMMAQAVEQIRKGEVKSLVQDETKASFQPVISDKDTVIDWTCSTQKIYDLIRGSDPSPGAVTRVKGEKCKIFDARKGTGTGNPGKVILISDDSFTVATGDGSICVRVVQPRGSKKIPAREFMENAGLRQGDELGK
ncbi:methionyl-tRNA formyltransferase [Desulfospira joergensenii]|uniref:methionyl-tRNA formyltransferase n=1 Tax=Desulfospira joergensenii TaxID=53329 RepID=UPI0003B43F15|nr:methionyl-tRNA formyltransferase [Desulfospira joergensenii]